MEPREISKMHAQICQCFANPCRIEIIEALTEKGRTTAELARRLKTTRANVSQHLKMMKDSGIVVAARQGRNVEYSLSNEKLKALFRMERAILGEMVEQKAKLIRSENK